MKPPYMHDDVWKSLERGLITLEEACRISAQRHLESGEQELAQMAGEAADKASHEGE